MDPRTQPLVGPMPLTPEWREARRHLITATDVAAILGQSEYRTALDVFAEKTGRVEPFAGNEATRRGTRYEPVILADYAEQVGAELRHPLPLIIHPTLACLGATPDAERLDDGRLIEAKLSMSPARARELGEEGTDHIPDDWHLQVQTQLACCERDTADLAVLLYGRLRVYTIQRHDVLIGIILDAAKEMAERVGGDDPPEPDWHHARTPALIRGLYDLRHGEAVMLPQPCEAVYAAYVDLGEQEKRLKAEREEAKARLLYALGDAEIGRLPGIGVELIRQEVNRKGYEVKETSFIQLRTRKVKA